MARRRRLAMPDPHPRIRATDAAAVRAAGPAGRADPVTTDLAGPAGPVTTDLAAPADPATTDLAGRAVPATTDRRTRRPRTWRPRNARTGRSRRPVDPAGLVARGTGTTSAATSMARPGETDPHPGVPGEPPRPAWDRPLPPPGGPWNDGPINYWGYNETPIWNPAVQPVGLRLLRSLDSAVKSHLTRRPLRPVGGAGVARPGIHNWVQVEMKNLATRRATEVKSPAWATWPSTISSCCVGGVGASWSPRY